MNEQVRTPIVPMSVFGLNLWPPHQNTCNYFMRLAGSRSAIDRGRTPPSFAMRSTFSHSRHIASSSAIVVMSSSSLRAILALPMVRAAGISQLVQPSQRSGATPTIGREPTLPRLRNVILAFFLKKSIDLVQTCFVRTGVLIIFRDTFAKTSAQQVILDPTRPY